MLLKETGRAGEGGCGVCGSIVGRRHRHGTKHANRRTSEIGGTV